MPGLYTTGFKESGVDIGDITKNIVEKSYLMDVYPGLIPTFAAPGLWVWGRNNQGQLGDNTSTNKSSPVQTVAAGASWKQVSRRSWLTAAIKTDGTLWTWGYNAVGGVGDNTTVNKSSPVQTIAGGTNWKQVSCGYSHVAAIKTDGTLWAWGYNDTGQVGDNTIVDKSSPVQTVAGGTNWKQVSAGARNTAAIKTDGTLWTWGKNSYGQLGDNTSSVGTDKSSPVQTIAGGNNWKQVSCGYYFTLAIKTDGTLWAWGRNNQGQLGDNTSTSKSSPVQTITGGNNWKQVAGGFDHSAAIKTDGTLWMWGGNNSGQIGDSTVAERSSPVQTIAGGTNWKQVSCGNTLSSAIKIDGTLWLWGINGAGYGALGNNTNVISVSSPIQTITGGNNWKQVSAGEYCVGAIKEFGDW